MAANNANAAGNSKRTWVRQKNVDRHPSYNVKDHNLLGDEDDLTVQSVLTPVLSGLTNQSNGLYSKKGSCQLTMDEGVKVALTGKGSKGKLEQTIPIAPFLGEKLKVEAAYVLAQYVTSRLCHGIGDYFLEAIEHRANWEGISADIKRCVELICAAEKPPEPVTPPTQIKLSDSDEAFAQSVLAALEKPRKNAGDVEEWLGYIKRWQSAGLVLPVKTRIDIREIACDKVAVYGKIRPIIDGKLADRAKGQQERLIPDKQNNTITWTDHMGKLHPFGPYKNIVDDDTSNTNLMSVSPIKSKDNLSGQLATEYAGGLMYDAVSTLASGVNVVLFGFGNSGTGKSFSLFGGKNGTPEGALQLILAQMKEVKLLRIFEEAPGGRIEGPGGKKKGGLGNHTLPNYDGRIISLFAPPIELERNISNFDRADERADDELTIDRRAAFSTHRRKLKMRDDTNSPNGIIKFVNAAIQFRQNQLRIRTTLNNGQSSRSHMYILIDVWCGNSTKGANDEPTARLCVIDLGGMERPESMLQDARQTVTNSTLSGDDKKTLLESRFNNRVNLSLDQVGMVKTITQLVNNIYATGARESTKKDLGTTYGGKLLLSDWVTGYKDIAEVFNNHTNVGNLKTYLQRNNKTAAVALCDTIDPFATQNTANPFRIMYPQIGNTPLFKPTARVDDDEMVKGEYFSLIHLAALYVEGEYIVESLNQVKEFLQNSPTSRNQTVLTRRLMASITKSKTRYIMLFTMCPVKLQADQTYIDKSDAAARIFDADFMEPAKFVQDVCSTALPEPSSVGDGTRAI